MKKISFFAIISYCFCIIIFFSSCQKEYSFEGGLLAQYSIVGSPATCMPAVVSGFYIEGKTCDSSNTLQINVNVTTAGNYTIFTIPVNGLSFTASGTFADTGFHAITLQCMGTPAAAGNFQIKFPGDNGCSFTLNVLSKAPASYLLAGAAGDCTSPISISTFIEGKNLTASDTIALQVAVKIPGSYTITTDTINGVSFFASGNFNSAGSQQVTLKGTGTPTSTGFFFFTVHSDSSQCNFHITVQNSDPVATYVLQSAVGNVIDYCTPQFIQGVYTSGVALNSSNTITISPYATVPGKYTISTGKIDGIIFTASGTFNALGNYNISLQGSGTPLSAGTFTFVPYIIGPAPIGGSTCTVILTVQ